MYTCPNIDISVEYQLIVPVPGSVTGETIVTPVYKKKAGDLTKIDYLPAGTNLVGKLAIDLNDDELNMVKGALVFLWIILFIFTIGCVMILMSK
jgi:hypothetical protein